MGHLWLKWVRLLFHLAKNAGLQGSTLSACKSSKCETMNLVCLALLEILCAFFPLHAYGDNSMLSKSTPVGIRKGKKEGLPGPRLWDVDPGVSSNPKSYTYTGLYLTWIAAVLLVTTHGKQGLVKCESRQTKHCSWQAQCTFVRNCNITILLHSINYLSAVEKDRPSPDKHHIPPVCCGTHRSLQNNTI